MRIERLVIVVSSLPQHADATCLRRLLRLAGSPQSDSSGIEGVLAQHYGIVRQRDWPLAPVLLARQGIDCDDHFWLVADPVTLVAGHNAVHLTGAVHDVAAREAASLIAALNAHFAVDDLEFVAPEPQRWFVRSPAAQALVTYPLSLALGQSLRPLLPAGPDGGKWRRWQDEIQMLLHSHPINSAREERGLRPVNAVWFWGGGVRPAAEARSIATWSNDGIAAALGAYTGMPISPLPDAFDAILAEHHDCGTKLVALDGDTTTAVLDEKWFRPAWQALMQGDAALVTLVGSDRSGALIWTAKHPNVWQRLALRFRASDAPVVLGAQQD